MPLPKRFRAAHLGGEKTGRGKSPRLRGPSEDVTWTDHWKPLDGGPIASTLGAELQREACPGHPLHRVSCRAIARNLEDDNAFVFETADPAMPVAFVRLTWQVERSPGYPYTMFYASWEAFRSSWADAYAWTAAMAGRTTRH